VLKCSTVVHFGLATLQNEGGVLKLFSVRIVQPEYMPRFCWVAEH
jgi:hypothetical protein